MGRSAAQGQLVATIEGFPRDRPSVGVQSRTVDFHHLVACEYQWEEVGRGELARKQLQHVGRCRRSQTKPRLKQHRLRPNRDHDSRSATDVGTCHLVLLALWFQ